MTTDIQAKIDIAARLFLKKEYGHRANYENCRTSYVGFVGGANHVLQHPELLREQMEAMLEWLTEDTSKYAILYGNEKRFCTNDGDLTTSQLFDLYIERLKQKA